MDLLTEIQTALRSTELSITLHAQQQMTARRIEVREVREALQSQKAEVIEDYPEDPRGPSCLIFGKTTHHVLHAHISYPPEIVVITAYKPNPTRWETDLKTRR